MTFDVVPLPLPVSVDTAQFREFGREVIGANLTRLSQQEFRDIENLLYKVCSGLFRLSDSEGGNGDRPSMMSFCFEMSG
jgi:hypothetical protein